MKLVPRLLVLGVALPISGLLLAALLAASFFRRSLVRDVDQRLFAQAAIESVSLFDGPDKKPHVHIPKSSLASEVAAFAPSSRLYAPSGKLIMASRTASQLHPPLITAVPGHPRIDAPDARTRTLTLGVEEPGDGVYTLVLEASLAPVDTTMGEFYRALGAAVAAIAVLLLAVLYTQARTLTGRVTELIGFVPFLHAPHPKLEPPAAGKDELAELGSALCEAAAFLHAQQVAQQRFLANAAHQLRTPLAVLCTEIDLALRRPRDAAELRAALESTRTEADRLTALARKLLDFENLRVQDLERKPVDLRDLLREVLERHGAVAAAKRVTFRVAESADALCEGDALLIAQAIENLVDNAVRFAPEDSAVTLSVRRVDEACELLVHDDGPGIPAAERGNVFEPFFRGSSPGSQTGLGLAFAADVARKHGGRVCLEPTQRGTSVRIEIPVRPPLTDTRAH